MQRIDTQQRTRNQFFDQAVLRSTAFCVKTDLFTMLLIADNSFVTPFQRIRSQAKIMQHYRRRILFSCCILTLGNALYGQEVQPKDYNPEKKAIPKSLAAPIGPNRNFGNLPGRLERASADAFNRGLMPLESRLRYLALARDARLSVSEISDEEVLAIWQGYRSQLAEMVPRIQSLNQPASGGWASELLLAQYALARADQQLAMVAGDEIAMDQSALALKSIAHKLYNQRRTDYSFGLATIGDVAFAKERLLAASNYDEAGRVDVIESAIATQSRWNSKGAEIGRKDRLLESQLTKDFILFQDSLKSGDPEKIAGKMAILNSTAHQHFQTTLKYFRNGTAPLHQLTNSMFVRQRLQQLSKEFPELENKEETANFERDWNALRDVAANVSDTRGRNAADLLAIQVLGRGIEAD